MTIMQAEQAFCKAHAQFEEVIRFVSECSQEQVRIDQVERGIFDGLLQVGLSLLNEFVAAAGDGDAGEEVVVEEKKLRRLGDQHSKPYRSIFGKLDISRHVYAVREGQKIEWAPLDAKLGLPESEQSYVLEDWLERLCVKEAFRESVNSLRDLLGIRTSVRAAEEMNRRLGEYAEAFWQSRPAAAPHEEEEILVITADGKGVRMRRPLEQRLAEEKLDGDGVRASMAQPDDTVSKADNKGRERRKKRTRKQMAYVGAVYSIAPHERTVDDILDELNRREHRGDRPRPQNKRVWAEMTHIREGAVHKGRSRLFISLALEAADRVSDRRKSLICIMDGEKALWDEQQLWFGRAVAILDIFHVTERLWDVANCFHTKGSRKSEEFVDHYLRMILQGKVCSAYGRFRRLAQERKLKGVKKRTVFEVIGYFQNNRERMHYDQYLAAGYPIGSGVVEGSCRHVVNDRLEQTGMRWEIEGAKSMVQTRCIYLNGEWDDFIEFRIQTEQESLYGQAA